MATERARLGFHLIRQHHASGLLYEAEEKIDHQLPLSSMATSPKMDCELESNRKMGEMEQSMARTIIAARISIYLGWCNGFQGGHRGLRFGLYGHAHHEIISHEAVPLCSSKATTITISIINSDAPYVGRTIRGMECGLNISTIMWNEENASAFSVLIMNFQLTHTRFL